MCEKTVTANYVKHLPKFGPRLRNGDGREMPAEMGAVARRRAVLRGVLCFAGALAEVFSGAAVMAYQELFCHKQDHTPVTSR